MLILCGTFLQQFSNTSLTSASASTSSSFSSSFSFYRDVIKRDVSLPPLPNGLEYYLEIWTQTIRGRNMVCTATGLH